MPSSLLPQPQLTHYYYYYSLDMSNQVQHCNGQASNIARPHFILVPFVAQGHMIPMVDLAGLLGDRGAAVSLITTPVNAARIRPAIDRVKSSGLPIEFVELDFPCAEAGLPDGCENIDMVTDAALYSPFYDALEMLRGPLELYLRGKVELGAACIISDSSNYWTAELARELGIPRLIFHGPSVFYTLCSHKINQHSVFDGVTDDSETVVVPELPRRVEVTRAQAPGSWFSAPEWKAVREKVEESDAAADGVVANTFVELEPEFVDIYTKAIGKPVFPVGPLSLYNEDVASKSTRGDRPAIDEGRILTWLGSKEPKSVLYVSFGSLGRTGASQLVEIGSGLESSGRNFVWAIKEADRACREFDEWLSGGFEERTRGRGLVIAGWAPQVLILTHPSVGGFVTHCGWNSTLEAVSAGVPMVTWPHMADQFLNEKLAVEVLGVALAIGVKEPIFYLSDGGGAGRVKRDVIERAVERLMDGGEEGEGRRERARELGEKAKMAMEEGGSSYKNLILLTKFIGSISTESK